MQRSPRGHVQVWGTLSAAEPGHRSWPWALLCLQHTRRGVLCRGRGSQRFSSTQRAENRSAAVSYKAKMSLHKKREKKRGREMARISLLRTQGCQPSLLGPRAIAPQFVGLRSIRSPSPAWELQAASTVTPRFR